MVLTNAQIQNLAERAGVTFAEMQAILAIIDDPTEAAILAGVDAHPYDPGPNETVLVYTLVRTHSAATPAGKSHLPGIFLEVSQADAETLYTNNHVLVANAMDNIRATGKITPAAPSVLVTPICKHAYSTGLTSRA